MYPHGLGQFYQKYTEAYGIPVLGMFKDLFSLKTFHLLILCTRILRVAFNKELVYHYFLRFKFSVG